MYVINAQQIATYDDQSFLKLVADKLKDNKKFQILFVVNKMDLVDCKHENIDELMDNCKAYIEDSGISNPILVPVSARSALLFKKVLDGISLSEQDREDLLRYYKHFKREGFSLQDYVAVPKRGNMSGVVIVEGIAYSRAQIYAALEGTGLPFLEKQIDEMLVRSLKMSAPKITFKKEKKKVHRKNMVTSTSVKVVDAAKE